MFSGGDSISPAGLALTLIMSLLVVALPKKFALFPVLALLCNMSLEMSINAGGLHFPMIRILLIFCWVRLIVRGELRQIVFNEVDRALVWFTIASVITHTFLLGADGMKYKLGQAYDAIGFYFFFRQIFTDWNEIVQVARIGVWMLVPLALEMVSEKLTHRNSFSLLGGVGSGVTLREGTVRAQGPFSHPILAGTFGATLMPFMVGLLLHDRSSRILALTGIAAATAITGSAGSSGPLLAYIVGVIAFCLWPLREQMRWLRISALLTIIILHLAMKAPVWFLLGRLTVVDGSTGFHRSILIDQCISHFSDWWLYGTTDYGHWGYFLFDRTNHYIYLATDGGLVTLVLFLVIVVRCFRAIGVTVRSTEERGETGVPWFVWALGSALMIHCVSFISVSYFDQNMINWYLLLAMISSAFSVWVLQTDDVEVPQVDEWKPAVA